MCDKGFDSFTTEELSVIEMEMRPGGKSKLGYLGDEDNLCEIRKNDRHNLIKLGISPNNIVDALRTIIGRHHRYIETIPKNDKQKNIDKISSDIISIGANAIENRINADMNSRSWCLWNKSLSIIIYNSKDFLVFSLTWGGAALCPFQSHNDTKYYGYSYGSHDYCIVEMLTKKHLVFNDLNLHMAVNHDFWEGPGTQYRLDPIKSIDILGLKPDSKFLGEIQTGYYWGVTSAFIGENYLTDHFRQWAKSDDAEILELSDKIIGFYSQNDLPINHSDIAMKSGYDKEWKLHLWVSAKDPDKGSITISDPASGSPEEYGEINIGHIIAGLHTLKKYKSNYFPLESECIA